MDNLLYVAFPWPFGGHKCGKCFRGRMRWRYIQRCKVCHRKNIIREAVPKRGDA